MQILGSKRIRTTAYHPIANGFIECLHHQLKAALKSHPNPTHWADCLPLVLLGIRTALKKDIHCTSAEFFDHSNDDTTADPSAYVVNLKSTMQQLKSARVRNHPQRKVHFSNALATCTHVFVRRDGIRKPLQPLQPPYDGPCKVLERKDKYFVVYVKGKRDTISLDRLKPAHLDADTTNVGSETPSPTFPIATNHQTPTRITRSGRHVHGPVRFST